MVMQKYGGANGVVYYDNCDEIDDEDDWCSMFDDQ